MARIWVELVLKQPRAQLVGLVDVHRPAAEAMADRFKLDRSIVFDRLAQAVASTGATVVFDVTIPAAHHAVTLEAFSLGCHVLGEKPMAESMQQAREMVEASARAQRLYAVTQTRRPMRYAARALRAIADGQVGPVQELHSDFFIGAHFSAGKGGKRDFRDTMEHPLLLDMAIHTFDNARQFSGADPVAVYCKSWNPQHSWYDGDACASAIFEMQTPDGRPIVYTYRGSWTNEGLHTDWNSDWRVVGTRGTLRIHGDEACHLERRKSDTLDPDAFIQPMEAMQADDVDLSRTAHDAMIDDFLKCVCDGGTPMCPAGDNIKSLAMVHAAVQSAGTGQRVVIKPMN
jgi:predicted dehydrogenase